MYTFNAQRVGGLAGLAGLAGSPTLYVHKYINRLGCCSCCRICSSPVASFSQQTTCRRTHTHTPSPPLRRLRQRQLEPTVIRPQVWCSKLDVELEDPTKHTNTAVAFSVCVLRGSDNAKNKTQAWICISHAPRRQRFPSVRFRWQPPKRITANTTTSIMIFAAWIKP